MITIVGEADPQAAKGYQELGDIEVLRGHLSEARKYYQKALSLSDPNGIARQSLDELPETAGPTTVGVKGIKLGSKDDYVVGMLVVRREGTILVATEKGMGKRTDVIQYRTQTRGGKGVMTMRCTEKTGKMVNIMEVVDSDDLIIITDSGVLMRQPVADIRTIGRVTQGVKLVKLDEGASISSITRVISEDAAAKEPEPEDRQLMIKDPDQQNEEE